MLKQIICSIEIWKDARVRYDNVDFKPIITRSAESKPLSVVVDGNGSDSEETMYLWENI